MKSIYDVIQEWLVRRTNGWIKAVHPSKQAEATKFVIDAANREARLFDQVTKLRKRLDEERKDFNNTMRGVMCTDIHTLQGELRMVELIARPAWTATGSVIINRYVESQFQANTPALKAVAELRRKYGEVCQENNSLGYRVNQLEKALADYDKNYQKEDESHD